MTKMKTQCPEFPHFGAPYPDARCIDGYLWDLDKCNENGLYSTGDNPPCPFCNTEAYINESISDFEVQDIEIDRNDILDYIEQLRAKYS